MGTVVVNYGVDPVANESQLNRLEELIGNAMTMRRQIFERYLDPRRNLFDECGYPTTGSLSARAYQDLYDREPIATRVVNLYPKESWQVQPTIWEDPDAETRTPFEEAFTNLSEQIRPWSKYKDDQGNPLWEFLVRADVLSGIGSFGVILLGLDDGLELWQPVQGVEEMNSEPIEIKPKETKEDATQSTTPNGTNGKYKAPPLKTPLRNQRGKYAPYSLTVNREDKETGAKDRCLTFLRVFPESLVQVTRYESNISSPRYGQPVMYSITFNDPYAMHTGVGLPIATKDVHWTRVVHLADNLESNESFGVPRMRPCLNPILDCQKVRGGSAEMYWQGAFPGLALSTHPQLGGDVKVNRTDLKDMMEQYSNGLQRWLALMGMTANTLSPTVVDPTGQLAVQIEAICIELSCPVRVFKGSERGELASTQDDQAWNDRLKQRQDSYITPRILVPFIDRLIMVGVLPEPEHWCAEWPDLTSKSDEQKSTVGNTRTTALAAYVSGGLEAIITPVDYLVEIMGMDEEVAMTIVENAEQVAAEKELEEMQQQQAMIDQGLAPDPTDPEQIAAQQGIPPGGNPPMNPPNAGGPPQPFGGGKPAGGAPPFGGGGPPKPGGKPPFVKNAEDSYVVGIDTPSEKDAVDEFVENWCNQYGGDTCKEGGGETSDTNAPKDVSPGVLGKVAGKIKGAYKKFSDRYGKKGAIAVMGAMALTMPIPGNILGVMAAAEGIRYVAKAITGNAADSIADMVLDAMDLYHEIYAEMDEDPPAVDLGDLRRALEESLSKE